MALDMAYAVFAIALAVFVAGLLVTIIIVKRAFRQHAAAIGPSPARPDMPAYSAPSVPPPPPSYPLPPPAPPVGTAPAPHPPAPQTVSEASRRGAASGDATPPAPAYQAGPPPGQAPPPLPAMYPPAPAPSPPLPAPAAAPVPPPAPAGPDPLARANAVSAELDSLKARGAETREADNLLRLAVGFFNSGETERGMKYLQKAESLTGELRARLEASGAPPPADEGPLPNAGGETDQRAIIEARLAAVKNLIAEKRAAGMPVNEAENMHRLSTSFMMNGNLSKAMKYAQQAEVVARR